MTTAIDTRPAWERFEAISRETHEMLIGAAQCRNHLRCILEAYEDMDDELREAIAEAIDRLERAGI